MSEWIDPYSLPDNDEQRRLHLGRYEWAKVNVRGANVANAACSCNYGSKILMECNVPNRFVVGFDRNPDGLKLARERYPNLKVIDQDIQKEMFQHFDALVSLETIEHLKDPVAFLKGLAPSVKELVASVPIIPTVGINEWHLHDFTKESFRKIVTDLGWKIEREATQDEAGKETYLLIYATR